MTTKDHAEQLKADPTLFYPKMDQTGWNILGTISDGLMQNMRSLIDGLMEKEEKPCDSMQIVCGFITAHCIAEHPRDKEHIINFILALESGIRQAREEAGMSECEAGYEA